MSKKDNLKILPNIRARNSLKTYLHFILKIRNILIYVKVRIKSTNIKSNIYNS